MTSGQSANRLEPVMIGIVSVVALALASYLVVGVGLTAMQRLGSTCGARAHVILDANRGTTASLLGSVLDWGARFKRHVLDDDMPLRHFLFASDCEWTARPPVRERRFTAANDGRCPAGAKRLAHDQCALVPWLGEPEWVKELNVAPGCPDGWVADRDVRTCSLPSLLKSKTAECPAGFKTYDPGKYRSFERNLMLIRGNAAQRDFDIVTATGQKVAPSDYAALATAYEVCIRSGTTALKP